MAMSLQDKLTKCRMQLTMDCPFFATLALRMPFKVYDNLPYVAATDGKEVMFSAQRAAELPVQDLLFVVKHEVLHVALKHVIRSARLPKHLRDIGNIAADLVVHCIMHDMQIAFPKTLSPKYEERFAGMSFEEVFNILMKEMPPQQKQQQSVGGGAGSGGDGGQSDESEDSDQNSGQQSSGPSKSSNGKYSDFNDFGGITVTETDETKIDELEREITARVDTATKMNSAELNKSRGTLPGSLLIALNKLYPKKTDWRTQLSWFFTQTGEPDYSYMHPDRRYSDSPFIVPGLYETEDINNLVIAVDQSGSCLGFTDDFFSHMMSIVDLSTTQVHVLVFDTKVRKHFVINKYEKGELDLEAGGGTDFRPVFDWVKDNLEQDPCCMVFLTDTYGEWPKEAPSYPLLITVPEKFADSGLYLPNYGTVIKVD